MRRAILAAALLAACGPAGTLPRCEADADCAAGAVCERPDPGEKGVCVAPFRIALAAPADGAWVGAAGAAVRATLAVLAAGRAPPAALDLVADGALAASLAAQPDGTYQGLWVPGAGTQTAVSLAAVAGRGTREEVASPAVAVRVDLAAPTLALLPLCDAAAPCIRDGTLTIRADAADPNLAEVRAALDIDPARPVPLAPAGGHWAADVDLSSFPFPALSRDVAVTVRARDLAGNEAVQAGAARVTRVRWAYDSAAAAVTSPAVMPDGTLVVGVVATTSQLRGLSSAGAELWSLTLGTGSVLDAPSVGTDAIYVGTSANRLFAVKLDGSAILNGAGCDTLGAIAGTPAVSVAPEVAYAGSSVGRLYAVNASTMCIAGPLTDPFAASPATDGAGKVLAATATATLRKYTFDGLAFGPDWNVQVGVNVAAPPAIDAADGIWTGSQDAKLNATTPAGVTVNVKTLAGSILDSPVILAGGDVVVGDQAKVLHRFEPDGTQVWATEPVLDGPVLAPLVLAGGPAAFLVPTAAGTIHAVAADGTVLWGGALSAGQALRAGNVHTPAGAPSGTAYFGCADGKVYAVAIEGALDASAPWPKAHHDTRNTGNAASPLP